MRSIVDSLGSDAVHSYAGEPAPMRDEYAKEACEGPILSTAEAMAAKAQAYERDRLRQRQYMLVNLSQQLDNIRENLAEMGFSDYAETCNGMVVGLIDRWTKERLRVR